MAAVNDGWPEATADRVPGFLSARHFPEVSLAILSRTDSILRSWRARSIEAMPELERLTLDEFENSIARILGRISVAMSSDDPDDVRRMIEDCPEHGLARFAQSCHLHTLLAEERIFRSVLICELRDEMGRTLGDDAAAALHELMDLMAEHSLLAMIGERQKQRDDALHTKIIGLRRLADLGTVVAGVAHDAMNILLPLRMRLEHLGTVDLPASAREDLVRVALLVDQFQNSIVNLRWLSVDPAGVQTPTARLDLNAWIEKIGEFYRMTLPPSTELRLEFAIGLPLVRISSAALSQIVFNLVLNAQQAIASERPQGRIVIAARATADGGVELTIEDDGPGMPAEVLQRCVDAFFTTRTSGSGLGLALVRALVRGSGGEVGFVSPPPGKDRGTRVVLSLAV